MKISIFFSFLQKMASEENISLDEALAYANKQGITGVQMGHGEVMSREAATYEAALKKTGISIMCIHCGARFGSEDQALFQSSLEYVKAVCDKAIELDAEFIMILPVALEDVNGESDRQRALLRSIEGLKIVAAYIQDKPLTMVIENISRYILPYSTKGDLKTLVEQVPGLTLALDMGNFRWACEDPLEAYDHLSRWYTLVHAKDMGPTAESNLKTRRGECMINVPFGQGEVPVSTLMERLKEDGYRGWYVIEYSEDRVKTIIPEAIKYLRQF
ncbi:MAG TPA: hypothetical protein DER23_06310 [Clostridiales bacterium]|mgnify:CR=1 FL=1|jgi:sugar phosphate isomerase/epimerase|nr:hypothetical protein [Clostridiales bacterium]HCG35943.1 hypothetical protein [Clostridiales bacterium]